MFRKAGVFGLKLSAGRTAIREPYAMKLLLKLGDEPKTRLCLTPSAGPATACRAGPFKMRSQITSSAFLAARDVPQNYVPALTRDFTGFPFLIGISAVVPSGISAKSRRRPPMPAT